MRISEVYHEINLRQIHFRLIKARSNPQLLQMEEHFKKNIVDFKSTDLVHAKEMDVKVSDMIIHEVVPVWGKVKEKEIKFFDKFLIYLFLH